MACERCGGYVPPGTSCFCRPFLVRLASGGAKEWQQVFANRAKSAAMKFVEQLSDQPLAPGTSRVVFVEADERIDAFEATAVCELRLRMLTEEQTGEALRAALAAANEPGGSRSAPPTNH